MGEPTRTVFTGTNFKIGTPADLKEHLVRVRTQVIPKIVAQQYRKATGAHEIARRVLF